MTSVYAPNFFPFVSLINAIISPLWSHLEWKTELENPLIVPLKRRIYFLGVSNKVKNVYNSSFVVKILESKEGMGISKYFFLIIKRSF